MGFIKTDPNQSKAVMPLLIVLVGAVAITVIRINGGSQPVPAAANTSSVRVESDKNSDAICMNQDSLRNPFKKPEFITAAVNSSKAGRSIPNIDIIKGFQNRKQNLNDKLNIRPIIAEPSKAKIEPMPVPSLEKRTKDSSEKLMPKFTLLATIQCGNSYSAVIKSDGKDERVVDIGDVLDCGFRVKSIDDECAVLTDGRNTIIAKRPNS